MNHSRVNVLYVDDEVHNLLALKAGFRRRYNIFSTTDLQEAENIIAENDIHVILADQRMPILTGVQFFEKVRKKHPDPIRILITGYTDISAAIDAINKGEVYRFLDKPWDEKHVEIAIESAFEIYSNKKNLEKRNIDLKKAYEELDKFVYSASHDLRAPLMSVLGIVNLAKMDTDVNVQAEYFRLIEKAVKKMDTFIINIIDYYKNTKDTPVFTKIDFKEVLDDIRDSIQYIPGIGNIKCNIKISQSIDFYSDIVKIRIIFNNLINNAIKFFDESKSDCHVNIDVNCQQEGCRLIIEDNGVGIKNDDIGKIFNMFYKGRVKNSGSGIGLYIVQESVQKLGGQISVSSTWGQGSIFEITLPVNNHNN